MAKKPRIQTPHDAAASAAPIVPDLTSDSYLDQVMVRLPCYEPNSHQFELTGEDLTRNVLITGSVGCGKTTGTINRILHDAIQFQAKDPKQKLGLVILDFKADDTVGKVRTLAQAAGREKDLLVIDGRSPLRLPLFAQLQEFTDIEPFVAALGIASEKFTGENSYWEDSRVNYMKVFLALLMASSESMSARETIQWLGRLINRDRISDLNSDYLLREATMRRLIADLREEEDEGLIHFLSAVQSDLAGWRTSDQRNASLHGSGLRLLISPFLDLHASKFLGGGLGQDPNADPKHPLLDIKSVIEKGKILVVSISAQNFPKQARMVGSMVKSLLYSAIAQRSPQKHDSDRLVLLVMDEYHLVATGCEPRYGDVDMLSTARSRRLGVVAATQGLINLEQSIGSGPAQGVLSNFNTQIFMHSNDPVTGLYATTQFGEKPVCWTPPRQPREEYPEGGLGLMPPFPMPSHPVIIGHELVCPPGALGRLENFQAFIRTADGSRSQDPVQFEPLFLEPAATPKNRQPQQTDRRQLVHTAEAKLKQKQPLSNQQPPFIEPA